MKTAANMDTSGLFCGQLAAVALAQVQAAAAASQAGRATYKAECAAREFVVWGEMNELAAIYRQEAAAFEGLTPFSGAALSTLPGDLGALGQWMAWRTQERAWTQPRDKAHKTLMQRLDAARASDALHQRLFPGCWDRAAQPAV